MANAAQKSFFDEVKKEAFQEMHPVNKYFVDTYNLSFKFSQMEVPFIHRICYVQ